MLLKLALPLGLLAQQILGDCQCQPAMGCRHPTKDQYRYRLCVDGTDRDLFCPEGTKFNKKMGCHSRTHPKAAGPANSGYTWWKFHHSSDFHHNTDDWGLSSSVRISRSVPTSTFTAVGFNEGYVSLEHTANDSRNIVFKLWNDRKNSPHTVSSAESADINQFKGRGGKGLVARLAIDWQLEDLIEVRVTGATSGNLKRVRCEYRLQRYGEENPLAYQEWITVAEFERKGRNLFQAGGFYSGIQDNNRNFHSDGCDAQRRAEFFDITFIGTTVNTQPNGVTLTKSSVATERKCYWKTYAEKSNSENFNSLVLSTGGDLSMNNEIQQKLGRISFDEM